MSKKKAKKSSTGIEKTAESAASKKTLASAASKKATKETTSKKTKASEISASKALKRAHPSSAKTPAGKKYKK